VTEHTNYSLEFNGEAFRVVEVNEKSGLRRQVGNGSSDLQLALRSACAHLGGKWLVVPVKVAGK
jgi:hypothetical protein